MTSLKSLAATERLNPENFWNNRDRRVFEAAVLEIAHAIKRGRKPNSCSVLPGQNIQEWLRRTFVEITPGCHDFMGGKCSIADDTLDVLYGWCYNDPQAMAICRAIAICRRYIRPIKMGSSARGDYEYQSKNQVTNLKRKARHYRLMQGTCYDNY